MFLIIFSIILLITNIYCFINKKYLYLFIPCMLFLPEYYGIEISESLPIISVTRIMFVILYLYVFLNKKISISYRHIRQNLPKRTRFLLGYFIFRIISNLYYLATYGQAAKTIFSLIFEEFGLVLAFYLLQPKEEDINNIIKSVVYSAAFLFVVGIFESYSYLRPFDSLYTVNREMLNDHYVRLGLLRATTTLGLPVFYGNMCILILPLVLYLYTLSNEKKYLAIIVLNFFATMHSGSRASILFFIAIIVLYFVIHYFLKINIRLLYKNVAIIVGSIIFIMFTLSSTNQYSKYYYEGTTKSILNEFGFSFNIEEDAPDGVEGFGDNKHGVTSRTFQFTGIRYAFGKNPYFGLGTGALSNGDVYYNGWGVWVPYYTYDMGIVEVLIAEGLIGFLGYLCLFIYIGLLTLPSLLLLKEKIIYVPLILLSIAYLLSTLSTANMQEFLIFIVILYISFFNNMRYNDLHRYIKTL